MKNRSWWFCLAALALGFWDWNSLQAQTNVPVAGIFQFSSSSYSASESESTPALTHDLPGALVTVVRTGGALGKMKVDYVITNAVGTNANIAWAGTNYLATNYLGGYNGTNGSLIFNDFQMSADIIIPIKDDGTTNVLRSFSVQLLGVQPAPDEDPSLVATLGTTTNATVRILDNDLGVNFTRLFYRVNEGGGTATVSVLYTPENQDANQPFTVQVRTGRPANYEPGSVDAVAGEDFEDLTADNNTLSFDPQNPQQTFNLTILTNSTPGFNKAIGLELYGTSSITIPVVTNETQTIEVEGETITTNVLVTNMVEVPVPIGPIGMATLTIMSQGLPSGSVDPAFNPELDPDTTPPMNALPGANNTVYALALLTNSKAIIGGDFSAVNTTPRARLARINADGSTDPTFTVGTGADGYVLALNLAQEGKIYIGGGFTSFNGKQRNYVAKLNNDGSLDDNFLPGANVNGPVRALASYVAGNVEYVLIGGDFTMVQGVPRNSIARLLPDGTIDATFNPGMGASGPVYAILRQEDGRILVGGDFTSFNGQDYSSLVRLNANGTLDTTFSGSVGADGPVYALAQRTVSNVTITNRSTSGNADTNDINFGAMAGTIQLTFMFLADTNVTSTMTNNVVVNYDGRVIFRTNNVLVSTNNVRVDLASTNFGPGNSSTIQIIVNGDVPDGMGAPWVYTGLIVPSISDAGQIIVGGGFTRYNGESRNGIARLNSDGSLDDTFVPGSGVDNAVYTICLAPGGGYYIAGLFTSYNGTRRMGLARILNSGKLDTSFLDTAFNQYAGMVRTSTMDPLPFINAMAVREDGNLLIGGNFQRLGGDRSPGYINAATTPPLQGIYSRSSTVTRQNYAVLLGGSTPGPGMVEIAQDEYFVDENAGSGSITLMRTNGSFGAATLIYSTLDGTAVAGVNYTKTTSSNTWNSGRMGAVPVSIGIIDDNALNGDTTFYVLATLPLNVHLVAGLPVPLGTALGRDRALMTIVESAKIPSFLAFSDANYRVDENGGQAIIKVIRTGNASARVTVDYATKRATNGVPAEPDINYLNRRGTLSFEPGQTEKTFNVTIVDNNLVEVDKNLDLVLSNPRPQYAGLGSISNASLTITDNDFAAGQIIFDKFTYVAAENQTNALISVLRVGGNQGQASVQYLTQDGTGVDGTHYLGSSGVFNWANGDSSVRSFMVPLIDDQLVSGVHSVQLMLTNYVNVRPGTPSNAVLNITESDSYGRLEFNYTNLWVNENEGTMIVNVVRKDGAIGSVSVDCVSVNGTATAGVNFVGVTNTLVFEPGQISTAFSLQILDDNRASANKIFRLRLENPVLATIGSLSNATVTILDRQSYNMPPGQLDNVFNPQATADNFIFALALQTNGNVVVAGDFSRVNGVPRNRIAQLSTNGVIDANFGLGSGVNGTIRALALQPDGRILIGGAFTVADSVNRNSIARLTSNGSIDTTFNPGSGAQNPVYALAVQKDGRILVGGDFATFNGQDRRGLVRLDATGFVDSSFNPGSGVNGTIYAITVQPDGKILIGGQFTTYNNVPQAGYARLNTDGSLDPYFNIDVGANGTVRTIAVQLDGRILLGGQFTSVNGIMANRLARLNADGTWDATFNMGEGADNSVYSIVIQPDGKPLIAGDFVTFDGVTRGRLSRLNSDGSLDPTINFGTGANGFIAALAVQPDRKIVLGGGFTMFNEEPRVNLARIYGGGLPGAGSVEFTAAQYSVSESATNALITVRRVGGTEGEIMVDCYTQDSMGLEGTVYRGVTNTLVFAEGEVRQTVTVPVIDNLQLDPARNVDLFLTNVTGGGVLGLQPSAVLSIKDDDTIVGFSSTYYNVSENEPAGSATILVMRMGDTTKTASVRYATVTGGTAVAGVDYVSVSGTLAFAPGETNQAFLIPIIDNTTATSNKTVVIRLSNLSGGTLLSPDTATLTIIENDFSPGQISFNQSSYSMVESGSSALITVRRAGGVSGTVSVDFSTVAGGTAPVGTKYAATNGTLTFGDGETMKVFTVTVFDDQIRQGAQTVNLRLTNPKGGSLGSPTSAVLTILDDDVGPGSLDTNFNFTANLGTIYAVGVQTDGRIVAAGRIPGVYGAMRLTTNGTTDSSFTYTTVTNDVYAMQLKTNNAAVIGGAFTMVGNVARRYAGQLTTSGQGDSSFSVSASENNYVRAVAIQKDNKVLIGGEFTVPVVGIARLNENGSLDVSFNPEGGTTGGKVNAIALQMDQKILVGGQFPRIGGVAVANLARLQSNGQLDNSFKTPTNLWIYDTLAEVKVICPQSDGKILVGGDFYAYYTVSNTTYSMQHLMRLNADGSIDDTFARQLPTVYGSMVQTIAVQPDGKIYIGGSFYQVGTNVYNNIARLHPDGTFDPTFYAGDGANGTVYDIAFQSDGKVLVAGAFTRFSGSQQRGLARLLGDTPVQGSLEIPQATPSGMAVLLNVLPGNTYILQATDNLIDWTTVATHRATEATWIYYDTNAPASGKRFFRATQ